MAGATGEVLQEYLVKLGFQTDQISLKKFDGALGATGKRILGVGAAVAGVVASVEAASAAFAYSMRKTYFAAELAGSSVKNMQAMAYAGKQFGISGDAMASSVKGMAAAIRANPGLKGLVESFGVKVTGRDMSDVTMDFVKAIKSMPTAVGQQYAGMFGMDPDTFQMMTTHFDEIIKKREELNRMQRQSGVDIDAQKKSILEYTSAMDKLSARFDTFASAFLSSMGPVFIKTIDWLDKILEGWTWAFTGEKEKKRALKELRGGRKGVSTPAQSLTQLSVEETHNRIMGRPSGTPAPSAPSPMQTDRTKPRNERNNNPGNIEYGAFAISNGAVGTDGRFAIFPSLEAGYAAQQKLLSGYGKKGIDTVSGVVNRWAPSHENDSGAYSRYVAKKMGIGVNDKIDLQDPKIQAGLSKHMSRYEGMPESALSAADRTRIGGGGSGVVAQTNNTTINVTGNGADATAKAVAKEQTRVTQDATRNLKGAIT
jgi:hypothetical protein